MTFPPLPAKDEVHLWILNHETEGPGFLSEEEQNRLESYRFESDQRRFSFTQSAKRILLGRYLEISPLELELTENDFGKPLVHGLEFSLSHTKGVSALAVSITPSIGLDIELVVPQQDLTELANRILSEREQSAFQALPENDQLTAFYRFWCAKESYLKNLGIGFEIEPDLIETNFPNLTTIAAVNRSPKSLTEIIWKNHFCLFLATDTTHPQVQVFEPSLFEQLAAES